MVSNDVWNSASPTFRDLAGGTNKACASDSDNLWEEGHPPHVSKPAADLRDCAGKQVEETTKKYKFSVPSGDAIPVASNIPCSLVEKTEQRKSSMTMESFHLVTKSFEIPPGECVPIFDEKPKAITVPEGEPKVSFKARVSGNPTPEVTWSRESGKPIKESAKTFFDSSNKQYVLKAADSPYTDTPQQTALDITELSLQKHHTTLHYTGTLPLLLPSNSLFLAEDAPTPSTMEEYTEYHFCLQHNFRIVITKILIIGKMDGILTEQPQHTSSQLSCCD
ncbi:IGS22 protein, partial [Polypterus senegalus]